MIYKRFIFLADLKPMKSGVLTELRKLNDVAYVRFASVYQSFNNISDFIDMIEKLEKTPE